MKAFNELHPASAGWTGLILLLTEKWLFMRRSPDRPHKNRDEHRQTDILTSGLTLLPPSRSCGPVAVGVCSPLQWRNRPRFSRGSRHLPV